MNDNVCDIESLVTAQLSELFLLLWREGSTVTCKRYSVTHIIKEDDTEAGYTEKEYRVSHHQ